MAERNENSQGVFVCLVRRNQKGRETPGWLSLFVNNQIFLVQNDQQRERESLLHVCLLLLHCHDIFQRERSKFASERESE